jgi:hypothetical protein
MENGKKNSYLETDTEKGSALKRWTPLPLLPNGALTGGGGAQ